MADAGIATAIADLHGRWLDVDAAFVRLLGYRADELAGRALSVLFDPGAVPDDLAARLVDRGEPALDARLECRHRDASAVRMQVIICVARDAKGAPEYLVAQFRDISSERAGDVEPQRSADRCTDAIAASQQQLQLFADAVAHDLRAPLRSIESFSGLLASRSMDRLDDTERDYLGRIRAAASRMGGLLAELSELSSVTRAVLNPGEVDFGLLAEWVGAELQEADPDRRAEIVVQPGLVGWGDERLLKQLLVHLMGNAWKFSRECDSTRIDIGAERDNGVLRLSVRDAGIGFDTRYAHKLFEPFQRLHGPNEGGGHGLGLTIAQRIAERHGGHISADSFPDGGATFTVELPAAAAADESPNA